MSVCMYVCLKHFGGNTISCLNSSNQRSGFRLSAIQSCSVKRICRVSVFFMCIICLSVCLTFRLTVCPSVCLYVRLSVCMSFCLSVSKYVCLYVCLFFYPSVCLYFSHPWRRLFLFSDFLSKGFCMSFRVSVCPYICLSVCPSVRLSVFLTSRK